MSSSSAVVLSLIIRHAAASFLMSFSGWIGGEGDGERSDNVLPIHPGANDPDVCVCVGELAVGNPHGFER